MPKEPPVQTANDVIIRVPLGTIKSRIRLALDRLRTKMS